MSDNTLVQKIKADAQAAVTEVQEKQAATIAQIETETKEQVADLQEEHRKRLEKTLAHTELVALSRAKQAANIALQAAKREELDEIISAVQAELVSQPSAEYIAFFTNEDRKSVV
jgi:vacuolar-type H+-ATPase subunit E/Vma4